MVQIKGQPQSKSQPLSAQRKRIYIAIIVVGNLIAVYLFYGQLFGTPGSVFVSSPNEFVITEPVMVDGGVGSGSVFDQIIKDLEILQDPRFRLLRALDIQINPPEPGRDNPFSQP